MSTYKWQFNREGKICPVDIERWVWIAYYSDGSILTQFDYKGIYHQIREIDQSRLIKFAVCKVAKVEMDHIGEMKIYLEGDFSIPWHPDQKLIYFYPNYVLEVGHPDHPKGVHLRFICFGFEKLVDGKNQKHLVYIDPNDRMYLTDSEDITL